MKKTIVIGLSGRFGAGKDYVANACGALRHSYAEPIYALARAYVGTDDKSVPGVRRLQQQIGQWMRGHFDADYPASAERGAFMHWLRQESVLSNLAAMGVHASDIGTPRVFADALLRRLDVSVSAELHVQAVTNVRFANEIESLRAHCAARGYVFVHALVVVANNELWERRERSGYCGADDNGVSEAYAKWCSDCALSSYVSWSAIGHPFPAPDVVVFNEETSRAADRVGEIHLPWFSDAHAFAAHVRSIS